jgi:Flp pilus assembly protein protease CpaA
MKIFLPLLTVVFITLKLLGVTAVATWSWWLVLLPVYFGVAVVLGLFALGLVGAGGLFTLGVIASKFKRK